MVALCLLSIIMIGLSEKTAWRCGKKLPAEAQSYGKVEYRGIFLPVGGKGGPVVEVVYYAEFCKQSYGGRDGVLQAEAE